MSSQIAANRRLFVLLRILNQGLKPIVVRKCSAEAKLNIGTVTKDIRTPKHPEFVPKKYYVDNASQTSLHHLRWMMEKDLLGQDIFLIGPPGPKRRLLAMQYLELTKRELEYVALNRDTTESDLKQRREIVGGSAKYFDQSAVRAAIEGRVLVLEGIEKAERNVLPVLNNLLENREMHLEDGRLLIPAKRYDELLRKHSKEELDKWKIVRVDEDFRVIALGLPVPKYVGNPLDPPLRSRFQARDISVETYQEYWGKMLNPIKEAPKNKLETVLSAAFALRSPEGTSLGLPEFPMDNLELAAKILDLNPGLSSFNIFYRLYPYRSFLKDGISNVENLLKNLKLSIEQESPTSFSSTIDRFSRIFKNENKTNINGATGYTETPYQNKLISEMLQTNEVGDFCIIGPRGCGKNMVVNKLAQIVGKKTENIVLYQDITSRDLIQQRTTLGNGDTVWRNSALIDAALEGRIAVIDGIHRVHPSTLTVIHRLVHDREIQLHDGKRLMGAEKYDTMLSEENLTPEELTKNGVLRIDPGFRVIALAEPAAVNSKTNWLTSEMLSLFLFHEMRTLSKTEERDIIEAKFGTISEPLQKIIDLAHVLRSSSDPILQNLAGQLSTRQILRIAKRLSKYPNNNVYEIIHSTFMSQFLPPLTRGALEKTILDLDITPTKLKEAGEIICKVEKNLCIIGNTTVPVYNTDAPSKVPNILFYDVPQHLKIMETLLQDFQLGSNLLLVGNQGVGKNKIVDRFLFLLNRPREYIQLHRDTTVQTLTVQPTVKDGLLVHEDSPLVTAIKHGHILVVDEADKAPTHVTCILKTLVESGEMNLSDGRKIVKPSHVEHYNMSKTIITHPDFRMIVLANRPGFPFLGNDFFGALGDLFSCHAVDNPSEISEIQLLKQYGPNVKEEVIKKLVAIFGELRTLADQGLVSYPYSTREVVNIVKHLQQFPDANLAHVLFNVFDFDRYSNEVVQTLGEVLTKHGFDAKNLLNSEWVAMQRAKEYLQLTVNRISGLDTSSPKHGKEDPKNEPHVGGNTWAGGTGGRDTAGLGGKGGPYRLDKGHKVHQLSDEEKNAVPEHVKKAAREMGRKAFEEKLKEIGMSGYDATLYGQFSNSVSRQVQSLRVILGSLQAKNKERQWSRHQTSGELDDVKLIDGVLGEKTVYKRRTEQEPELGAPQIKPKRLRLVVDVSGSMYRFNSYDGRLERELEAVVLVMEAFQGFEDKIKYDVMGHSGDSHDIKFVSADCLPDNDMKRLQVIRMMHAHSQYCWSGDNTLAGTQLAVESLSKEDCDEAIVVVLSDANLSRYGIPATELTKALTAHSNVSAFVVFIGSLGDQAEQLTKFLPSGRGFVCKDVGNLPQILKQIFSSSVVNM